MVLRLPMLALAVLAAALAVPAVRGSALAAAAWVRDGFVVVFVDAANFVSGCF